jgi:DNA-binding response OmpR family regulator
VLGIKSFCSIIKRRDYLLFKYNMDKTSDKKIKHILIAEDEKPYSRAMVLKLQHAGFDAQSVGDGEEAVALLKTKKFDLLILDLVMPKMDGFGVLEELKKLSIKLPIMVLSNLTQDEDKKKTQDLGVQVFVEKSNTAIVDVINKVEEILKN